MESEPELAPLRPRRTKPRRWRRWILICLLAYGLMLGLIAAGCGDRLVLYPTTKAIDTSGLAARRQVAIPGGGHVEIWVSRSAGAARPSAEPQAYVLALIGNAARAEPTAPFFAKDWGQRPVEVWAVNYPGYGGSDGSARLSSIGPAALAAYDELRRHAGDKPIFVQARSIGTAAALHVAASRPVAGCILHNPPPLRQLILGRYGWFNLWLISGPLALSVPSDLDSLVNARRVQAPAIFLLAGADGVVPVEYQNRVANPYAGEKRLVNLPSASHVDRAAGPALVEHESALDWIWARTFRWPPAASEAP